MSDIIIKGVEMPASCSACPLADYYINNLCKKVFYCRAGNIKAEGEAAFEKRADGCPLENTAKGKWEQHDYLGLTYWTCSVCGNPYNKIKDFHYCPAFNYCPNCGAEMEMEGAK